MSVKKKQKKSKRDKKQKSQQVVFDFEDAESFQQRLEKNELTPEDLRFVSTLFHWYMWLVAKVKGMRKLGWLKEALGLSDTSSKKQTKSTNEKPLSSKGGSGNEKENEELSSDTKNSSGGNPKGKGHGKTPISAYTGAERKSCPHGHLRVGDRCPLCDGKLYELQKPKIELRFTGSPPVTATAYELQQLQCSSCRKTFTASLPDEAGWQTYDEKSRAILGILTYTQGFPAKRIEKLQSAFGVPVAAGTQWDQVKRMIQEISPVYQVLLTLAAQLRLFYHDDSGVKIVELLYENRSLDSKKNRVGMHTTAIVAEGMIDGVPRRIILYFSSRKHAGENLDALLEKRENGLEIPLQMEGPA
jgi:transposase